MSNEQQTTTQPDEKTTGATGKHTTDGRPHGFSTITPFLAIEDAGAAIDFYRDVFGAQVVYSTEMGGKVVHAELTFDAGRIQLGVPQPDYHLVAQPSGDDVSFSLAIYRPDVDACVERAVAAGAVVREPVVGFVSGDRYGSIRDPFGIRWSVMTRVEDLSDEESAKRIDDWAAQQG